MLTEGQRNEMVAFGSLMEQGAIKREGRGRPKVRPERLCGDKGYSNGQIRRYLRLAKAGHPGNYPSQEQ